MKTWLQEMGRMGQYDIPEVGKAKEKTDIYECSNSGEQTIKSQRKHHNSGIMLNERTRMQKPSLLKNSMSAGVMDLGRRITMDGESHGKRVQI